MLLTAYAVRFHVIDSLFFEVLVAQNDKLVLAQLYISKCIHGLTLCVLSVVTPIWVL